MKFEERQCRLRNGADISIRLCQEADGPALAGAIRNYLADSEHIPRTPEEFNLSPGEVRDWIRTFALQDNALMLIALHEGRVIGNIDLNGSTRQYMQHTAVIGMGIVSAWRNTGLGTALMNAVIGWARQHPVLELLWLQVYADNATGLALYEKMGFSRNGLIPDFFKHGDRYHDIVTMSLDLRITGR